MLSPEFSEQSNYRIMVEPLKQRVEIFVEGDKVVESKNAFVLYETGRGPVFYIPREEVNNLQFIKYDNYFCPYKGTAELYHIKHNSRIFQNAAWSYLETYDDCKEIEGCIAFYPGKVQAIRVTG